MPRLAPQYECCPFFYPFLVTKKKNIYNFLNSNLFKKKKHWNTFIFKHRTNYTTRWGMFYFQYDSLFFIYLLRNTSISYFEIIINQQFTKFRIKFLSDNMFRCMASRIILKITLSSKFFYSPSCAIESNFWVSIKKK